MYEEILKDMIYIAQEASKLIMKYFNSGFDVEIKDDNSPVTQADKNSDKLIRDYLSKKYPSYPILSEETADDLERLNHDYLLIVDPLDGTCDFVNHESGFAVNIALAYDHEIVAGVIAIPYYNKVYYASRGNGAFKIENGVTKQIHVSDKTDKLTCLTSAHHMNDEEERLIKKHSDKIRVARPCGSSYKACQIAEGLAEISYRLSPNTKEWDTAPFEIIVAEAGGLVLKPDLTPMHYNGKDVHNREGYIIVNRKENLLL